MLSALLCLLLTFLVTFRSPVFLSGAGLDSCAWTNTPFPFSKGVGILTGNYSQLHPILPHISWHLAVRKIPFNDPLARLSCAVRAPLVCSVPFHK